MALASTRLKRLAIAAATIAVGVPVLLGLTAVVSFYALFYFPNRTSATAGTIVSSGVTRQYLLYVPKSYDPARPAPDVTRLEYTGCADGAGVVLYTVKGGGHQWPGGRRLPELLVGPYTRSIDATHLSWAFFREHPRRPPPSPGRVE